ncbi:hypothetical protein KA977_03030 [Candidatus Dependentiae bacterium]|nr:hypothetical protein [Candidatus Dependentiae bacterium]
MSRDPDKTKEETELKFKLIEENEQIVKRPAEILKKQVKKNEQIKIKIDEKKQEKTIDKKIKEEITPAEEKITKSQKYADVPIQQVKSYEQTKSIEMFKKTETPQIEKNEIIKQQIEIKTNKEISAEKTKFENFSKKIFESSISQKKESINLQQKQLEKTAVSENIEKKHSNIEIEKSLNSRTTKNDITLFEKKTISSEKNNSLNKSEDQYQSYSKQVNFPDKSKGFFSSETKIKESEQNVKQNEKFSITRSTPEYSHKTSENYSRHIAGEINVPKQKSELIPSKSSNVNVSMFSKTKNNVIEYNSMKKTQTSEYTPQNAKNIQTSKSALLSETNKNYKQSAQYENNEKNYTFSISSGQSEIKYPDNSTFSKKKYSVDIKQKEIKNNHDNSNLKTAGFSKNFNVENKERADALNSKKYIHDANAPISVSSVQQKFNYKTGTSQIIKETKNADDKSNYNNIQIKNVSGDRNKTDKLPSNNSISKTNFQNIKNDYSLKQYNVKDEQINLFNKNQQASEKNEGTGIKTNYQDNNSNKPQNSNMKYSIEKNEVLSGHRYSQLKSSSKSSTNFSEKKNITVAKLPENYNTENSYNDFNSKKSKIVTTAGSNVSGIKTVSSKSNTNSAAFSSSSKSKDNVPIDLSIPMPEKPGSKSFEPQKKAVAKADKTGFSNTSLSVSQNLTSVTEKTSSRSEKSSKTGSAIMINKNIYSSEKNSLAAEKISGGKTVINTNLSAQQPSNTQNNSEFKIPSYKTSGGQEQAKLFIAKNTSTNKESKIETSKNFDGETQNKTAAANANKLDVTKYKLKNANSKYLSDNVDNQQAGGEGRVNVNLNLTYKKYKMNPEYLKLIEKKSQDTLNLKLKKTFPGYKEKIKQSMQSQKLFGDIELYFENNGKLKKIKYADGDVLKNKKLKQIFEGLLNASNLILPVDLEVMVVIKIEFEQNSELPEINYQFFW